MSKTIKRVSVPLTDDECGDILSGVYRYAESGLYGDVDKRQLQDSNSFRLFRKLKRLFECADRVTVLCVYTEEQEEEKT